jgi:hypothetical protein
MRFSIFRDLKINECWVCGEDHNDKPTDISDPKIDAAYAKAYLDGYSDAEKHYTNKCTLCGTGGTVSWLCNECKKENPHWIGE